MKYNQEIILKNGTKACLRNGDASDGLAVYENFNLTHAETDFLLSYPDENSFDPEQEARFLKEKTRESKRDRNHCPCQWKGCGNGGHRGRRAEAQSETSRCILDQRPGAYWGLGLGKALTQACIQCARDAGYEQLELNVVAGNERALSMYQAMGFVEFGRNPRGFNSRESGFQELVYMLLKL